INEADLFDALQSGQVAGAALDVYETEPPPADFPLRELPQIIMTPHLGASTEEAQENVGIEVAEAITEYLLEGAVRNAVNLPVLPASGNCALRRIIPDEQQGPSGHCRLYRHPDGQAQREHREHEPEPRCPRGERVNGAESRQRPSRRAFARGAEGPRHQQCPR